MTIYPTVLYIKQHSVTGLKYFGKTTKKDPYKYLGSGVDWKLHLKEYGSEHVITLWVSESYTDKDAIISVALAFSRENNIVESKAWANLKEENGLDGVVAGTTRGPRSTETKQKISDAKKGVPRSVIHNQKLKVYSDDRIGVPRSTETKQKLSEANKGKPSPMKGRPQSPEHIKKRTDANTGTSQTKVTCPHCGKIGGNAMKRWHFDNCKMKPL